jgi:hypothetical protein
VSLGFLTAQILLVVENSKSFLTLPKSMVSGLRGLEIYLRERLSLAWPMLSCLIMAWKMHLSGDFSLQSKRTFSIWPRFMGIAWTCSGSPSAILPPTSASASFSLLVGLHYSLRMMLLCQMRRH